MMNLHIAHHGRRSWRPSRLAVTVTVLSGLLCAACAGTAPQGAGGSKDSQDYAKALPSLTEQTVRQPQDAKAWARLGEAQYRVDQYPAAKESFARALALDSGLVTAQLYLGYMAEADDSLDLALWHYQAYTAARPGGKTSETVGRRVEELRRARAQAFASAALAHERELQPSRYSDSTLGVVYFNAERLPEELRPLAKGLAEMLVTDLAKVRALRVVERLKTDRLLSELALSHTAAFDTSTAPRLGKLLGAAHLLGGDIAQLPQGRLRFDPQLVATKTGRVDLAGEQIGAVDQFFQVQKQIVFDVLQRLGIEPTPTERVAIGQAPTESFAAFLAFSRGLGYQDLGMYAEARREFQRAVAVDPQFHLAGERARQVAPLSAAPPSDQPEKLETFVKSTGDAGSWQTQNTDTEERLGRLMDNSGFVQPIGGDRTTDEPYTPPSSTTTVIIHGRFDQP